jgi:hypothetical protein
MVLSIKDICFIPLRNKQKEIINYTIVDEKYFEELNKFRYYLQAGYTSFYYKEKKYRLHRYIFEKLLEKNINNKVIDHIDNNRLNNTTNNLRMCTRQENSMNKTKQKNTTSKYYGVSYSTNKWIVSLKINENRLSASYKNEHYAAHQYNLWIDKYKLEYSNKNLIKENISDFVLWTNCKNKSEDNQDLPKGIFFNRNRYFVKYLNKDYGFNTLEEATRKLNEVKLLLKNKEEQDEIDRLNIPIKRNKDNIAIVELFNIKKEKVGETLVDDEYYYILIKYKWHINCNGYVNSTINLLHRYIFQVLLNKNIDNKIIDHINSNRLDNRKSNLRIVTHQENALNQSKQKHTTSKYIGVSFAKNMKKYSSEITVNSKKIHFGYYKTEDEAVEIRNKYIIDNKLNAKIQLIKNENL